MMYKSELLYAVVCCRVGMRADICSQSFIGCKCPIWPFRVNVISLYPEYGLTMKYILIFLGTVALIMGVVGVFLPVLPTTPFLLLAAALYMRGSGRMYNWLLSHPFLGEYIRNFKEYKAIPLRVKVVSVACVWVTLLYCAFFVAREWWMSALFVVIAFAVSFHILHYRTLKK